jgi:osmotically-inducible protein OsmY
VATPAKIRADDQIQQDVLDELSFDARVQPNEVGVIVKDGVVTLTGWLDSYPMRQWPISCPGLDPRK